ncbi:MAG: hypothetical protein K0R84_71 [Clostridia bacterium]|nr:hypothetical protein [Clostridia bacterium]
MRGLMIFVFICLYAALIFFGLGPVLFADGSIQERLITLAIVASLFVLLTLLLRRLLRRT